VWRDGDRPGREQQGLPARKRTYGVLGSDPPNKRAEPRTRGQDLENCDVPVMDRRREGIGVAVIQVRPVVTDRRRKAVFHPPKGRHDSWVRRAAQDATPWNPPVNGLLHGIADASQRDRKRRLDISEIS